MKGIFLSSEYLSFIRNNIVWFKNIDFAMLMQKTFKIVLIISISIFIVKTGSTIIKKVFEKQKNLRYGINSKKVDTVITMLTSVFRYFVYFAMIVTLLTDVFELKSIFAAASVCGVALGLGIQGLIKDIIAGFFIVLEDHYVVGDVITIDNMNGVVEELQLRVTKFRNLNGDLYVIPNGEVKKLINHTRGNKTINVDIPVSHNQDHKLVFKSLNEVCNDLNTKYKNEIEVKLEVLGIIDIQKDLMIIRISGKVDPKIQLTFERTVRLSVKEKFSNNGINFS